MLLAIEQGKRAGEIGPLDAIYLSLDDPLMPDFIGAQAIIRFTPIDIFPNCPRYIPDPATAEPSPYIPNEGEPPVEPKWKSMDMFKDVVPPRKA